MCLSACARGLVLYVPLVSICASELYFQQCYILFLKLLQWCNDDVIAVVMCLMLLCANWKLSVYLYTCIVLLHQVTIWSQYGKCLIWSHSESRMYCMYVVVLFKVEAGMSWQLLIVPPFLSLFIVLHLPPAPCPLTPTVHTWWDCPCPINCQARGIILLEH